MLIPPLLLLLLLQLLFVDFVDDTAVNAEAEDCVDDDVEKPEKFHKRIPPLPFLPSANNDEAVVAFVITEFLTTFDIIEQFPNDAELRTFGGVVAVIFSGTVHVALNDAERWTWLKNTGVDVDDLLVPLLLQLLYAIISGGADFGGGGILMMDDAPDDDADSGAVCGGGNGGFEADENFFGDGVDELSLC